MMAGAAGQRRRATGRELHAVATEDKARFRVSAFAVIEQEGRVLLARRRDIGWWNLPGGGLEHGETVDEALRREVREEIGVEIVPVRVVGVYSKTRKDEVALSFLCHLAPGQEPTTSEEVSETGWFAGDELPADLLPKHRERVIDALLGRPEAVVRAQRTSTEEDQGLKRAPTRGR
jgi:ADP-ribose pyrophosphatase YjhB (NUDIX family)